MYHVITAAGIEKFREYRDALERARELTRQSPPPLVTVIDSALGTVEWDNVDRSEGRKSVRQSKSKITGKRLSKSPLDIPVI